MKKRFLSILVCLCMLSILLPSAVSAADKAKPYFYTKIRRTKRLAATWQGYKDLFLLFFVVFSQNSKQSKPHCLSHFCTFYRLFAFA